MSNGLRKAGLQDIEEPIWIETNKKALEQNNQQVFLEDWFYLYQRKYIYLHHQVQKKTHY